MYAQDTPEAELASSKLQRAGAPSRADSRKQAGRGALAFLILTPKTRRWLGVPLMDVAPSIENFSASCGALTCTTLQLLVEAFDGRQTIMEAFNRL